MADIQKGQTKQFTVRYADPDGDVAFNSVTCEMRTKEVSVV